MNQTDINTLIVERDAARAEVTRLRAALAEIASEYGVAYERDPYEVSAWNLVVIARKALEEGGK